MQDIIGYILFASMTAIPFCGAVFLLVETFKYVARSMPEIKGSKTKLSNSVDDFDVMPLDKFNEYLVNSVNALNKSTGHLDLGDKEKENKRILYLIERYNRRKAMEEI